MATPGNRVATAVAVHILPLPSVSRLSAARALLSLIGEDVLHIHAKPVETLSTHYIAEHFMTTSALAG